MFTLFHCENIGNMSVSSLFFFVGSFLFPNCMYVVHHLNSVMLCILCVPLVLTAIIGFLFILFASYFLPFIHSQFFALLYYQFVYYFFTPARKSCVTSALFVFFLFLFVWAPFHFFHLYVSLSFSIAFAFALAFSCSARWHAICSYFTSIYVH